MTSASNLLHYPWAMTMAQAHAREEAKAQGDDGNGSGDDKDALLAAADDVLFNPDYDTGLTQGGKHGRKDEPMHSAADQAGEAGSNGARAPQASRSNGNGAAPARWDGVATGLAASEQRTDGRSDGEIQPSQAEEEANKRDPGDGEDIAAQRLEQCDQTSDYELNEGEELVMQVRKHRLASATMKVPAKAPELTLSANAAEVPFGAAQPVSDDKVTRMPDSRALAACLQVLCDELRLAGYNNVHFAIAVLLSGALQCTLCAILSARIAA